jgi:hypothetical protein
MALRVCREGSRAALARLAGDAAEASERPSSVDRELGERMGVELRKLIARTHTPTLGDTNDDTIDATIVPELDPPLSESTAAPTKEGAGGLAGSAPPFARSQIGARPRGELYRAFSGCLGRLCVMCLVLGGWVWPGRRGVGSGCV